jgi:hypothetical protein
MSGIESVWAEVQAVLATATFWVAAVGSVLAGMVGARQLAVARMRRGEEPVAAARSAWMITATATFVLFLAVAVAWDSWSVGTLIAGSVLVLALPLVLALLLARPVVGGGL